MKPQLLCGLLLAINSTCAYAQQSQLEPWDALLKPHYFPHADIVEDATVIDLTAPYRSEDAAVTPIRIKAMMAQTPERYIAAIHLFVDENPEPLVGRFDFTPAASRADLALHDRAVRGVRTLALGGDAVNLGQQTPPPHLNQHADAILNGMLAYDGTAVARLARAGVFGAETSI